MDDFCHLALKLDHDEHFAVHAMPMLSGNTGGLIFREDSSSSVPIYMYMYMCIYRRLRDFLVVGGLSVVVWVVTVAFLGGRTFTGCGRAAFCHDRASVMRSFVLCLASFVILDYLLDIVIMS